MNKHRLITNLVIVVLAGAIGVKAQTPVRFTAGPIQFDMIEIDKKFVSEGVGVADVDKDGDMDLFVGDYWYEAPGKTYIGTWIKREIRPANAGGNQDIKAYSECHGAFVGDFNNDGYPDPLIVPFHGKEPTWYENPKNKTNTRWVAHGLGYNYGVEQSLYTDINGTGKKSLITSNLGDHSWSYWTPDATGKFLETKITPPNALNTGIFDHGLGMNDVNGDGKPDLIHQLGWYENPSNTTMWKFHADKFSDQNLTQPTHIWTYDFNKDGRLDIFTASSHYPGVWWFSQTAPSTWKHNTVNPTLGTNHAMIMKDLDMDGIPDIISGKRYFAHDVPADGVDVALYWVKSTPGPTPKFDVYKINPELAGVGTQFEVQDINEDNFPDIIVSNKAGVKIYLQVPRVVSVTPALQTLQISKGKTSPWMSNMGSMLLPTQKSGVSITIDGRAFPSTPMSAHP